MSVYKYGQGWNVAQGSLATFSPQPATVGYQYARRSFAASGAVYDEAPFVELVWDNLESTSEYNGLLTALGISVVKFANVTVYVQNDTFDWVRQNGIAVRPLIGTDGERRDYFLRNFTILVKGLHAAT